MNILKVINIQKANCVGHCGHPSQHYRQICFGCFEEDVKTFANVLNKTLR